MVYKSKYNLQKPYKWRQLPGGEAIALSQSLEVDLMLQSHKLRNACLIGPLTSRLRLHAPDDVHILRVSSRIHRKINILADEDAIPVAKNSVDLVVLSHLLEYHENPHGVLKEAYRILRPEGHIMIFCYNPVSMWGLIKLSRMGTRALPWNASSIHRSRLIDWMSLLDFEVVHQRYVMHRPPVLNPVMFKKLRTLEWMGQYLWPFFGAINMIVGKKHTSPLTPIRLRSKLAKLVNGTLAATNQNQGVSRRDKWR